MKKAVKMVIIEAFERMDIVRIEAKIFETNIPSRKVLQNNGFKLEGRKEKSRQGKSKKRNNQKRRKDLNYRQVGFKKR